MTSNRQLQTDLEGLKQTTVTTCKQEDASGQKTETAQIILEGIISAPVEQVFPLCCPVEEYKWIPGWKCRLIHCPNDRVERGTVFEEIFSAPFLQGCFWGRTTWTAVHYDNKRHQLHFRLENKISSSLYKIEMFDDGQGGTLARLDFTYTPLNRKGRRMMKKNVQDKILPMIKILSRMLKVYCEQKQMIRFSELQALILAEQDLSVPDKIHMAVNRLILNHIKDSDRARLINRFDKAGVSV